MALGGLLLGGVGACAVPLAAVTVWGNSERASAGPGTSGGSSSEAQADAPPASPVRVTTTPAVGQTNVAPAEPAVVHVADGRFSDLGLVGPDGAAVPGHPTPDGWTSTATLAYGASYTWKGVAFDGDGTAHPLGGSFTTVTPANKVGANLNIADGASVGIAAPIIVQFDGTVTDKAAAQRALSVQTSVPTTGSGAWLPDTEQGSR